MLDSVTHNQWQRLCALLPNHLLEITMRTLALAALLFAFATPAVAEQQRPSPEQVLLQKMYQMRIQLENERARRDNEARANVRLQNPGSPGRADSPTVSGLRAQTNQQLARMEQQFRCLDVDFEANGGNTVVICGDNSGDISGSTVAAGRDIVTFEGGTP